MLCGSIKKQILREPTKPWRLSCHPVFYHSIAFDFMKIPFVREKSLLENRSRAILPYV
jgi:hypothetical protein